jgi:hypothetical protein
VDLYDIHSWEMEDKELAAVGDWVDREDWVVVKIE